MSRFEPCFESTRTRRRTRCAHLQRFFTTIPGRFASTACATLAENIRGMPLPHPPTKHFVQKTFSIGVAMRKVSSVIPSSQRKSFTGKAVTQ
jgi:hypothetical protein